LERRSDRRRDNSVAESHVDLDVHLAWSERRSYLHFDSVVPIGVAIRDRRSHVIGVEDDSIIDVDTDDLAKARSDVVGIAWTSGAGRVDVAREAVGLVHEIGNEDATFEKELFRLR